MKHTFAVALSAIALGEAGQLVRIPLAVIGRWAKGTQKFAVTKADLAAAVENFRKRLNGEVVIDYEHASEYPQVAAGGPIPAAGWLKAIEDGPDEKGVLWGLAEFTTKAREMIAAAEYKYISPVLAWGVRDPKGEVMPGLTIKSVALTNRPVLQAMPAIALSEEGWIKPELPAQEKSMVKKLILSDRAAGKVRVILEDDSESVLSVEGFPAEPKVIRLSDVARDKDGQIDLAKLGAGDDAVHPEVLRGLAIQIELSDAVKAGKITPAQRPSIEKLMLTDLEAGRKLVASMAKQVDLSERGIAGGSEGNDLAKVDAQIDQLVQAKCKADAKLSYGQALKLVLSERSDLANQRVALMRE